MTELWFDALAQFFGGRGDPGNEMVRFGLATTLWGGMFIIAWARRKRPEAGRERLLIWGFGFGFAREAFMFLVFLRDLFTPQPKPWHQIFPPIDHALTTLSVVLVAAAFIEYLRQDGKTGRRFMLVGIVGVAICYLASFLWWADFLAHNPAAKFGQTWCDWAFRFLGVSLSGWAIFLIFKQRGWLRNLIISALCLFLLDDFLKLIDMAAAEHYEPYLAPIRHGLHIAAVFLLGVIYLREMLLDRSRLAAAVENAGDSILLISPKRVIEYVNPTFCRYTGYSPQEVIGRPFREVMETSRHEQTFYQQFWQRLEAGMSWQGRMFTPRKGGGEFEGERQVTVLHDRHHKLTGYVCVTRDISQEKEIEYRLMQAQKMEAVGTLSGGIAHDFNNLLTPIMGYTEVTRNKLPEGDPLRKNLDQVLIAAERASEMVASILTISRKNIPEKKLLEMLPLVREALRLFEGTLPPEVELQPQLHARHSLVEADAGQINQVVMNLLTNAVQAMEKDGGIIEVGLEEVVVDAEFAARHAGLVAGIYLCLSVRDTGPGLSAEVEERIFEPFFTTREKGRGAGLGLAIVNGIIKNHKGAIEVESSAGDGALFRVFLPMVEGTMPSVPAREKIDIQGREHIMLVDDEKTIVVLGRQVLESLGYQVTSLVSGQEALDLLRSGQGGYDMLVTDLTMPEMTGMTLAREALALNPDLPVILCTGYLKEDTRQLARDAGIRVVLPKPYTLTELNHIIRHVFDG